MHLAHPCPEYVPALQFKQVDKSNEEYFPAGQGRQEPEPLAA